MLIDCSAEVAVAIVTNATNESRRLGAKQPEPLRYNMLDALEFLRITALVLAII
jgi:hypothetical protein